MVEDTILDEPRQETDIEEEVDQAAPADDTEQLEAVYYWLGDYSLAPVRRDETSWLGPAQRQLAR